MTTKSSLRLLAYLGVLVMACSCASSRKILYLQDLKDNQPAGMVLDYEPTIKPDDRLYIVVSAPVREVAAPYNLSHGVSTTSSAPAGDTGSPSMPSLSYRVDADGCIDFPVLGRIQVEGSTLRELTRELTTRISFDVKDPVVNITFANYRVTILGEVRSPGTYNLPSERTTIFQAIGMAGDLTIAGRRKDVLLLRETDGRYEYARLDLRNSDIFSSPYYYIHQNDMLYISPAPSRIQAGTASTAILSTVFSTTSVANFILTLVRLFNP
jgi:polysaccharide export outer membrane protein